MGRPDNPEVDLIIRDGSKGQLLIVDVGQDISSATAVWFEYIAYGETDYGTAQTIVAEKHPTDLNKIQYKTLGTEFAVGYWVMVAAIQLDADTILYSDNKKILQVKKRFE